MTIMYIYVSIHFGKPLITHSRRAVLCTCSVQLPDGIERAKLSDKTGQTATQTLHQEHVTMSQQASGVLK